LALCQRYFQIGAMKYGGYVATAVGLEISNALPVVMRASPTITNSGQTNVGCSGSAVSAVDATTVRLNATGSSGPGFASGSNYTAAAEL
jgi:hypothetical protein